MEVIEILREVSKQVYENVKNLAGTDDAAGDFGRGAGGDISRNIDIVAEKTVLDYLKKINFDCIVLGEECGRVELSENPKGYIIMDRIVDKDEDLDYLDDYKLMNPYILKLAREKISKGGDEVLKEFEEGFKDARIGQYLDIKLKQKTN